MLIEAGSIQGDPALHLYAGHRTTPCIIKIPHKASGQPKPYAMQGAKGKRGSLSQSPKLAVCRASGLAFVEVSRRFTRGSSPRLF